MKRIIKLSIVILGVFACIFLTYAMYPRFEESDLYEVSGICTSVREERGSSGKTSYLRRYIVIDNEEYYISKKLWKYIGGENSVVGHYISFSASDKSLSLYYSHEFVTWNDNEESKQITLEILNSENSSTCIVVSMLALLIGTVVMLPDILSFSQKIYEKKLEKISEENKAIRKAKKQMEREYFNKGSYASNIKDTSKKRSKR